jgi:hypothetical protein
MAVLVQKSRLSAGAGAQEVYRTLLEEVDNDKILAEYGGGFNKHLYESEQEIAIRKHVAKVNQALEVSQCQISQ